MDQWLVVLAHSEESFIHTIDDKPESSTILVWHYGRTLYLDFLSCVMEVDRYQARGASSDEVKLEEARLLNSRHVKIWSHLRT